MAEERTRRQGWAEGEARRSDECWAVDGESWGEGGERQVGVEGCWIVCEEGGKGGEGRRHSL